MSYAYLIYDKSLNQKICFQSDMVASEAQFSLWFVYLCLDLGLRGLVGQIQKGAIPRL